MQTVFSILIDALAYGMVLFIISIGLSVTMGLMRVVNLAHGAFAMIGGYLASYAAHGLGLGYAAAILVAIVGTIVIAIPLERFLYRRIYGAPELTQVLMTIGNLYRTYRPLRYFGIIAAILAILSVIFLIPVLVSYHRTGLVNHFPTLIVCGFSMLAAIQALFTGLMLHTIAKKNRQDFEIRLYEIAERRDKLS